MARKPQQPTPHVEAANQYIADVLSGAIPACKWVKAACQRQVDNLAQQKNAMFPYEFDPAKGERICTFISRLPHIKGPLANAGQLISLEPWQSFILATVFGWVCKSGTRKGMRRFRRVYIEVPRGNAKSTLSSGVGLYCLSADGESGASIYSAATTRNQARIVFEDAQMMARKIPEFRAKFGLQVNAHNINQMSSASKFEALSSEGHTLDGLNIHLAIIDELHAHKTRDVYDVLETGAGKRQQSLIWAITTAGSNMSGICYEIRTYLTKVLDRVSDDDSFFGTIFTLDDGDDWTDPESWRKANPNWGISVEPDNVGQLARKAMQSPASINNFKTKHLDVWVTSDSALYDMRAWLRCTDETLAVEDFEGQPCVVALDLAHKTDLAAKVIVFPKVHEDGVEHYYVFGRYYLPEAAISESGNSQYSGWEIEGRIVTTPGDVTDFDRIEDDLIEDSRRYDVTEIAYDPWQATQLAQHLQSQGATTVEYRAVVANFSEPTKMLDALMRQGRIHHDGDPALAWMISNVVGHVDVKDNVYPRKMRPENKIDGAVALIMALGRLIHREGASGPSVYEDRGLLFL